MGQSLGDLHYTLGIDDTSLDQQLASAKEKIKKVLEGGSKGSGFDSALGKSFSQESGYWRGLESDIKRYDSALGKSFSQQSSYYKGLQLDVLKLDQNKKAAAAQESGYWRGVEQDIKKYDTSLGKANSQLSNYYRQQEAEINKQIAAELRLKQAREKAQSITTQGLFQSHIQGLTATPSGITAMNAYYRDLEKSSDAALKSQAKLDKQSLSAANAQKRLADHAAFTNKTFLSQGIIASQLSTILGTTFSVYAIGAFVKKLAEVRGEFELQSVALRAITRDKEAADKIFGQVKTLSVKSPFTFMELLRDTKQLAAFSVETDKLFGTLTRLADVSAGLGVDMNRIILAYGQVKAATVLRGQELRQFTEAGIPIIDMLANKFTKLEGATVSAGDVFKRISEKMVSFKDVDEIFTQLTSSGGMFFEMQKKQSETLAGKLANLKDAYMIMLNAMGQGSEGVLKGGADMLYSIMTNWSKIADVIKVVIAMYGAYKAVVLITSAVESANTAIRVASIGVMRANIAANIYMSSSQVALAASTNLVSGAFIKMGAALKANWIGLAITALAGLSMALYNAYQNAHELENALNKIKQEEKGTADAQIIHLQLLTERLKEANMGSLERKQIITELNNLAGPYLQNLLTEKMTYKEITEALAGTTNAIYENAKAKAYQSASKKVTENLSKGVADAESQIRSALETIGVKGELSAKIIGTMFGDVKNNPKLTESLNTLTEYINETISKVTGKKSAFSDPFLGGAMRKSLRDIQSGLKDFSSVTINAKKGIDDVAASVSIWGKVNEMAYPKIESIKKATLDSIAAYKASIGSAADETKIRDIKIKGLQEEADAYRALGLFNEAAKAERDAIALNPLIDSLGRLKQQVEELQQFKDSGLNIGILFPENRNITQVSDAIIEKIKETETTYKSLVTAKKGIYTSKEIEDAHKIAIAYRAIAEQLLGWREKEKPDREDPAARLARTRAEAMQKLNEQYLKDHEDFVNYDLGIEARRIANMEASMAKELMLNDLTFEKREADIVRLRQIRLEELNAAAGIKRGAPNEITDFSQTAAVISGLSDKQLPASERSAVQAASDQAMEHEKQMRLNNEKDKAEGIIAINRDWALKIKEIWRDVNDAFLYGIEKERAALNEKYDDWARQAKLANVGVEPDSKVAQDSADLLIDIERQRLIAMKTLDTQFALDQLDFYTEIEYKKNELKVGLFDSTNKLERLNFETFKRNQLEKIKALEASFNITLDPSILKQADKLRSDLDLDEHNLKLKEQKAIWDTIIGSASMLPEIFKDSSDELKNVMSGISEMGTGIEGIVKGIASENPVQMLAGFIGAIDGLIKATGNLGGDARIKDIEKINKLLEEQARIVAKASREGNEQIKRQAELSVQKSKLTELTQHQSDIEKQISNLSMSTAAKIFAWINPFTAAAMLAREIALAKLKKELASTQTEIDAAKLEVDNLEQELLDYTSYGATQNTIADAIAQAYLDAKGSVKDFADYTNQILRDAVLSAFKANVLGDALNATQKLISEALAKKEGEDKPKLTEGEIATIRASLNEDVANAKGLWDSLMGAFPELYTDATTAKKGLQGDIHALTEDTGQLLASFANAIRGDVSNQLIHIKSIEGILSITGATTSASLDELVKIQDNTFQVMMLLKSVIGSKVDTGLGLRVYTW